MEGKWTRGGCGREEAVDARRLWARAGVAVKRKGHIDP
jgi:hypothetical protein